MLNPRRFQQSLMASDGGALRRIPSGALVALVSYPERSTDQQNIRGTGLLRPRSAAVSSSMSLLAGIELRARQAARTSAGIMFGLLLWQGMGPKAHLAA
jgi:hypothetical protein